MKKKLTILAALATCVTIGGVYAGWLYAGGSVENTAYGTAGFGITGTSTDASVGTLAVSSSKPSLLVDDTDDGKVHNTVLTWNAEDYFLITFQTSVNAKADVKATGVDLKWNLGLVNATATNVEIDPASVTYTYASQNAGEQSYDGVAIFSTFDDSDVVIKGDSYTTRTENSDSTVTFTYKVMLNDIIYANYDKYDAGNKTWTETPVRRLDVSELYLTSADMHTAYGNIVNVLNIHFHVSEYVAPAQQG